MATKVITQAWDVSFERLGRRGPVSFTVRPRYDGAHPLAMAIAREASKHLISKGIDIEMAQVDDGSFSGAVSVGFVVFPFVARLAS